MEFAKYYEATNVVEDMLNKKEIDCYPTGEDKFLGVYVCMDKSDFWVCRILKGYDENFEHDDNKYLVERNQISVYDVMYKLHEQFGKELPVFRKNEWSVYMKNKVHNFLNQHNTLDIIKAVLILDDEDGLSNWDYYEEESLEKAIAGINGGYGILKVDN